MHVAPYDPDGPIYYEFTACPTAEFARQFGLLEVMPALCSPDYAAMELLRARLVRRTTCSNGCRCDYTICGDRDAWCQEYPEYRDEAGYRRNTPDGGSMAGLACPASGEGTFPAREKYPKAHQNQGFGILFGRQVGVSVGRGLNVVSASVLRRDDTTFRPLVKFYKRVVHVITTAQCAGHA